MAPFIRLKSISKHFADVVAVDDLSLDIEKVELICFFLTHSPCSKFKRNRKDNSTKNPYHHQMRQEFILSPGSFKHLGDMIYRPTSRRKVSMVFPVAA